MKFYIFVLTVYSILYDFQPIWSKGPKKYRFEENRPINQKLTFGVLFSVVLATGLGLGNLAAYNECEQEHKVALKALECPCTTPQAPPPAPQRHSPRGTPFTATHSLFQTQTLDSPPIQPLPTPIKFNVPKSNSVPGPGPEKVLVSQFPPSSKLELEDPSTSMPKPVEQNQNRKYELHTQELTRVIKLLDELSRKLDKFENTTRHLDGVVVMKGELVKKELMETVEVEETSEAKAPGKELPFEDTGVHSMDEKLELKAEEDVVKVEAMDVQIQIPIEAEEAETVAVAASEKRKMEEDEDEISQKRKRFKRQKNVKDESEKVQMKNDSKSQVQNFKSKPGLKNKENCDSGTPNSKSHKKLRRKQKEGSQPPPKTQKKPRRIFQEKQIPNPQNLKFKNSKQNTARSKKQYKKGRGEKDSNFKVNVKKVQAKAHHQQPQHMKPGGEWGTVRAQERAQARKRDNDNDKNERIQMKLNKWYFDRARGREKSRR